jgi:hypothetical protein
MTKSKNTNYFKTFDETCKNVYTRSKTADKNSALDVANLGLALKTELRDNPPKAIKYDFLIEYIWKKAGYNPKDILKDGQRAKSPSFEMRVTRAVRNALLDYEGYNPNTNEGKFLKNGQVNSKHTIGYIMNDKGNMTCSYSILVPTINRTETDKATGKKITYKNVKNEEHHLVDVPFTRINSDFGKCFEGAVKSRAKKSEKSKQGQKNASLFEVALELSQEITKLQPINVSETDAKCLLTLENALTNFFSIRSSQESVEIETELRQATA